MIAHMASPLSNFRKIVFANTLRGCQIFTGLPSEDLDLISSFVIPRRKPSSSGAAGISVIFLVHWASAVTAMPSTRATRKGMEDRRSNGMGRKLRPN